MLTIGRFSKLCEVSTKTLRYYDDIGLLKPSEINPDNGYRYYATSQLEVMLFINRLKLYNFSLDEIKLILDKKDIRESELSVELNNKRRELKQKLQFYSATLKQLDEDINALKQGKSMMSYLNHIEIQLVEMPIMHLLSIRKMLHKHELTQAYSQCFSALLNHIQKKKEIALAPPMVLFHGDEFLACGMDIEFAIPVTNASEYTREFHPGLCGKTVLHGSYRNLSSIYTKQCTWAEQHGYVNRGPLFEVYVNDPFQVEHEDELVTEIYYPVMKQ